MNSYIAKLSSVYKYLHKFSSSNNKTKFYLREYLVLSELSS